MARLSLSSRSRKDVNKKMAQVRRWDGAARTSDHWDSLRKDPELWMRNGNCLVYLYGKGQSRRGPSFNVPFSALLQTECYPMILRFLVEDNSKLDPSVSPEDLTDWYEANPRRTFELYIPPPSSSDKTQALQYHLATRNFFAWIFRRSMVGEHLGEALVGLLHSMHEFRSEGTTDNIEDVLDYMDEEGYLDLSSRPNHALALLQFAEYFQMEDLYVRAFGHCVGMSEMLHFSTEFEQTSEDSKRLIRKARANLDARLQKARPMMTDLLDEDLSDSHLGIPSDTRAHLERFRSFLLSFYAAKFGYYPPKEFGPDFYRSMLADFEALYQLLVDDAYTSSKHITPAVALGGICTQQLLQSFDARHGFDPLAHPLPLMPQMPESTQRSKSMKWLLGEEKMTMGQRQVTYAALIKACNWKADVFQNDLVRAYRRFEENSVTGLNRADRQERVSLMDARKVRWILVYTVYQVLLSVAQVPEQLQYDVDAPYHLAIPTEELPPWGEADELTKLLRRQTELFAGEWPLMTWEEEEQDVPAPLSLSPAPAPAPAALPAGGILVTEETKIEIKPDVDYFALVHRELPEASGRMDRRASYAGISESPTTGLSRSSSFTNVLSRSSTLRRSMRMFNKASSSTPALSSSLPSRPSYHEILVHGYGNGLNDVNFLESEPEMEHEQLQESEQDDTMDISDGLVMATKKSNSSIGAKSDTGSDSGPESLLAGTDSGSSTTDGPDSVDTPTSLNGFSSQEAFELAPKPLRPTKSTSRRNVMSMVLPRPIPIPLPARSKNRPMSFVSDFSVRSYSADYEDLVEEQREQFFGPTLPIAPPPRSSSYGAAGLLSIYTGDDMLDGDDDGPMRFAISSQSPQEMADEAEWAAMQAFMDGEGNAKPAWEQYAELGGLTPI